MGFPTKNDHFGVFWGTTIFGNIHIDTINHHDPMGILIYFSIRLFLRNAGVGCDLSDSELLGFIRGSCQTRRSRFGNG